MEFDEYESLPYSSVRTNMMAGAAAGIMEHCVMYPFDVVKTRMQNLQPLPGSTYRTVPEALYKIMRHEGMLRPLRGMNAMVVGAGPAHALYFSSYEKTKRMLTGTDNCHSRLAQVGAGSLATLLHDAIMTPAEVVKQRLQVYQSPYKGVAECALGIWQKEGYRAFFRSYTTAVTMNIPFQCVHFLTYEYMQDKTNYKREFNPKAHMLSGAIAGAFAAAITTPLDVCKTLLNTQDQRTLRLTNDNRIDGLQKAFTTVYRIQGFKGYFRGIQARVMFQMPGTAISWSVYEFFKYALNKNRNE